MIEQENDAKWAELGDQVSLLKSLSLDINNEIDQQNSILSGMGDQMTNVAGMFTNTLSKMGEMLTSGGGEYMYYLAGFVVLVFLAMYFLMR